MIKRMTSPQVLDAALADERIARLPMFAQAPSPRAALARAISLQVLISQAEEARQPAINMLWLAVDSPVDVFNVADAVAAAMCRAAPEGTTAGRPLSVQYSVSYTPMPWHHDWQILGVLGVALVLSLVVCCLPARRWAIGNQSRASIQSSVSPMLIDPELRE